MMDSTLFCTNAQVLADGAPRVATGDAPRPSQMQGSGKASASSESEEGSRVASGPVGALTGLPLPKAVLKIRASQHPEAPRPTERRAPLERGLPNTSITACQELMLAIVAQAMVDKDVGYIESPMFIVHLCYVGLDMHTAVKVQTMYLMGKVDVRRLNEHSLGRPRRVANPGP